MIPRRSVSPKRSPWPQMSPDVPEEVSMAPRRSTSPSPYGPKEVRVPKEVSMAPRMSTSPIPCVPKEVPMTPNVPRCPQGGPHVPKEVLMSPSPCVPKEVHVLKDVPKEVHVPKSFMSPRMSLRRSPCPQGGPQGCPCPCVAANTTMSIWCPPTPHPQSLGVSPCPIKVSP